MATSTPWIAAYTRVRSDMVKLRGEKTKGATGAALPRTRPLDCYVMLAELHADVIKAIGHITVGYLEHGGGVISLQRDTTAYLAARPKVGDSLVRWVGGQWIEAHADFDAKTDELEYVRHVLEKWDRCLELAGATMATVLPSSRWAGGKRSMRSASPSRSSSIFPIPTW